MFPLSEGIVGDSFLLLVSSSKIITQGSTLNTNCKPFFC